jgi:hypothetical protein
VGRAAPIAYGPATAARAPDICRLATPDASKMSPEGSRSGALGRLR